MGLNPGNSIIKRVVAIVLDATCAGLIITLIPTSTIENAFAAMRAGSTDESAVIQPRPSCNDFESWFLHSTRLKARAKHAARTKHVAGHSAIARSADLRR
jgi:hypothetical protein